VRGSGVDAPDWNPEPKGAKKARALAKIASIVPRVHASDVAATLRRRRRNRRSKKATPHSDDSDSDDPSSAPRSRTSSSSKRPAWRFAPGTSILPASFEGVAHDLVSLLVPVTVDELGARHLGLLVKKIDGKAVVRGFHGSSRSGVMLNDVVVSVGSFDAWTYSFDRVIARLRQEVSRFDALAVTLARPHYDRSIHAPRAASVDAPAPSAVPPTVRDATPPVDDDTEVRQEQPQTTTTTIPAVESGRRSTP